MIVQRSTDEVIAPRRFDFWREAISATFVDLEPRPRDPRHDGAFTGKILGGQLGDVVLCNVAASSHEVVRSPALIRRARGDFLFVSLLLDGNIVFAQEDRVADLAKPGQFVLYDSAKPYRVVFRENSRQLVVRIPRDQLTQRLRRADKITALTIGGTSGVEALAAALLQSLAGRIHDVDPYVIQPLLDNAIDVLAVALVRGAGMQAEPTDCRALHLHRARECIRRRLGDADLTPHRVAREIGVSERYLYALFRADGSSPARAIMEERLDRAHAVLGQPHPFASTVESLALRLGFKHATHFTRAFKGRYGLPPSQYRERALSGSTVVVTSSSSR